ncbi:hypothetical protein ACTNBF_14890 [Bariatricus sp. HCP28S3_A4]|uniref:hypothetical protein n=1 Tax=Bariatricus sp. HCP28S3_A4 TaxID=3438893 RepID=UPI003F88C444
MLQKSLTTTVFDKLYTKYSNEPTLNCLPVFDWSENDFNFNVPINVSGNVSLSGELTIGDTNVLDEISTINNNLFNLNYETSEVKTGEVWIDGKPIYRKVFQVSAIQSKVVTINHNISNANIVWVDTSHSFLLVGNNTYSLPRIGNSINQCVGVQATRSTFTISAGSDASFSGGAIVTLLYTKTT